MAAKRSDLLGHQHRVPQREQEQAAGRGLAPLGEQPPQHRRVLIIGRGRHVLIADKQGIECRTVCRRGSLDHPARSLARICHVRVIARQRDPRLSSRHPLSPAQGLIRPERAVQAKDRLRLLPRQSPAPRLRRASALAKAGDCRRPPLRISSFEADNAARPRHPRAPRSSPRSLSGSALRRRHPCR